MNTLNTTTTTFASASRLEVFASAVRRLPVATLAALYAWQAAGKRKVSDPPSFLDRSSTKGDTQIDYAKPIWKR